MHNLIARWIPKSERSRAATFIWSGIKHKNVLNIVTDVIWILIY